MNLLNDSSNEESKFATKRWYVIDSQATKINYKQGDTIKFEMENVKSSLCDYSDALILVTGNITVNAASNTDVAFKNCAPFSTCKIVINDVFVDKAGHVYIEMPMYNTIEYIESYSDSINNSILFKYKAAVSGETANHNNGKSSVKYTKIAVRLKCLSNFWRSLEMPLMNCKVHLKLMRIEDCILSSTGNSAKFGIKDANLRVPIVTFSANSVNFTKQLSKGFKRSANWNSY